MSINDKLAQILNVNNKNSCIISSLEDGWVINGVSVQQLELPAFITAAFHESFPLKKKTNFLFVLQHLGSDVLNHLALILSSILRYRSLDAKFLVLCADTVSIILGSLADFLETIFNYLIVADLGSLFELAKQYDSSLLCWQKVVDLEDDFFIGWMRLSFNYYHTNNIEEAIRSLWKGVKNNGLDIPDGVRKDGKVNKHFRFDLQSLVNLLFKKAKRNYQILFIQGLIAYQFTKDYPSAIQFFLQCLKINSSFSEAEIRLSQAYGRVGDKKSQLKTLQRMLEENSSHVGALHQLATINKNEKRYQNAVRYFEQLHNTEPANPVWLRELIFLYRTSTLSSAHQWTRDLNKAYFYYRKLFDLRIELYKNTEDFSNLLIEIQKFEEAKDLLFNHLAFKGLDKILLRKLEQVYTWLKLPFDKERILLELNYHREKDTSYPKILDILSQVRPNIPVTLPRIAKFVNFPEDKMEGLLIKLAAENPDVGEYLELEQVFIRKENTDQLIDTLKVRYSACYYCGQPFESTDDPTCTSCGKEILKCVVCKLPISFGEEVGKCSLCEAKGHLVHMEEWVKTQGKCPYCQQELPLQGVIPEIEELKK